MSSINKVILIGRLGADPETRFTEGGSGITNIRLATSENWKDKQTGQKQERTEWHRVTFFGKLAEIAGQYLQKGSLVYVEGSLRTRQFEKDGVKQYATDIIGSEIRMLSSKGNDNHSQEDANKVDTDFDDDIPF